MNAATPSLYAVTCDDGSLFVFAGDKAIYSSRTYAVQVVFRADKENRKTCHCNQHKVVRYKAVKEALND